MKVPLVQRGADEATVTLVARAEFPDGSVRLRYETRTGALLRIDGVIRGAFDGKHTAIDVPPLAANESYDAAFRVQLVHERNRAPFVVEFRYVLDSKNAPRANCTSANDRLTATL